MKRIVVVGAGISGLATAWHLDRRLGRNATIEVFEESPHVGGTARSQTDQGYLLETGPNGFLDSRVETLELCRSLGLSDQLIRARPAANDRFVFLGDRLRKLPRSPWEFLTSDLLSARGKARVLLERWIRPRLDSSDESIEDFGCRRLGKEATRVLLNAFVTGIVAGDSRLLSLRSTFPRIHELETTYGSLFRAMGKLARQRRHQESQSSGVGSPTGTLTTMVGGMGTLTQTLAAALTHPPRLSTGVRRLSKTEQHWNLASSTESLGSADAVVLACPTTVQARLIRDFDPLLADELDAIPYSSAVVAVVGYREADLARVPKGFGYLAPINLGRPVLGVIFSSEIFPDQAPTGYRAFRIIMGGWNHPEVVEWPDDRITETIADEVRTSLGISVPPAYLWTCRWPRAIPQYHLGHQDRLARIDSHLRRWPGLFLGGNALRGIAINDCATDARRIADAVEQSLSSVHFRDSR